MEKIEGIPVEFIGKGRGMRWRVGPFQSRKHYNGYFAVYYAARKFIHKMLGYK